MSFPFALLLLLAQDGGAITTAASLSRRHIANSTPDASGLWQLRRTQKRPLCGQGKHLPELYVLGAKKAATTSFAADLMKSGIGSVAGAAKEWHFFDSRMDWRNAGDPGSLHEEYKKWLRELPPCPHNALKVHTSERNVLADFTPENLLMIPLPGDAWTRGPWPPWKYRGETALFPIDNNMVNLPKVLTMFYGLLARNLVFTILLREPLRRMQSGWHAFRSGNAGTSAWECSANFSCALKDRLEHVSQKPTGYRNAVFSSLYGQQVKEWLIHFDAKQFVFVPYRVYTTGHMDSICRALEEKLNLASVCESLGKKASMKWHNEHPLLDNEVEHDLLFRWQKFLKPDLDLLLSKLSSASRDGAFLAAYDGPDGSKPDITTWLLRSW